MVWAARCRRSAHRVQTPFIIDDLKADDEKDNKQCESWRGRLYVDAMVRLPELHPT